MRMKRVAEVVGGAAGVAALAGVGLAARTQRGN
jgi:hypothetical protein